MQKANYNEGSKEFPWFRKALSKIHRKISVIASLLTALTKSQKFEWSNKCEASYQEPMNWLTSMLMLTLPELYNMLEIYINAYRSSLGFMLLQENQVIAYGSRKL